MALREKQAEEEMADITTDVMIVGTGPAGSATAALLSSYGVPNFLINPLSQPNPPTFVCRIKILEDLNKSLQKALMGDFQIGGKQVQADRCE